MHPKERSRDRISCFPHCCDNIADKSDLKNFFWLTVWGKACFIMLGEAAAGWGSWTHSIRSQGAKKDGCWCSTPFVLSVWSKTPQMVLPTLMVGLQNSLSPVKELPHKPVQGLKVCLLGDSRSCHIDNQYNHWRKGLLLYVCWVCWVCVSNDLPDC